MDDQEQRLRALQDDIRTVLSTNRSLGDRQQELYSMLKQKELDDNLGVGRVKKGNGGVANAMVVSLSMDNSWWDVCI